jgi:hypothetical protein
MQSLISFELSFDKNKMTSHTRAPQFGAILDRLVTARVNVSQMGQSMMWSPRLHRQPVDVSEVPTLLQLCK